MKKFVFFPVALLMSSLASEAWAVSIDLPDYNQVFNKTTTATFELPDGWVAKLTERASMYSIEAKIDGTPMELGVDLQLVPQNKGDAGHWQEISAQYTKNYLNAADTEIVGHKDLGNGLWCFQVKSKGRVSSVNYHLFRDGAGHFVELSVQNDFSAMKDSVNLGAKKDDIEKFLKSVRFSEPVPGKPNPAVKTVSTVKKAEAPAAAAAPAAKGPDLSALKGTVDIAKVDASLEVFSVEGGEIASLDAAGLGSLREIKVSGAAKLAKIRIRKCPMLKKITLADCASLEDISFDDGLAVEELVIAGSMPKLTSLNVTKLSKLKVLGVKGLKQLESLWAGETELTELDLSGCSELAALNVEGGKIKKIMASGCEKLEEFSIEGADDAEVVK